MTEDRNTPLIIRAKQPSFCCRVAKPL